MNKPYRITSLLALLAVTILAGCAKPQPPREKVYWPPPPNEPKMEWIITYSSEDDFEKSDKQIAAEKFLGKTKFNFFLKPGGVASRGDGVVYVADLDASEIRVIDFNNKTSTTYSEKTPVALPVGMTMDSKGSLFVADARRKHVVQLNPQRKVVRGFGVGDLERPTFVALDEKLGRLYVSDVLRNEVLAFDLATGEKLFAFGGQGSAIGQLYVPQGIAVDDQGRIFVAEQLNARIQVFDSEGKHLYMFGQRGDKTFNFEGPRGLAFDSKGNLFVAEARKSALLVFQPDGTPLTSLGGSSSSHPLGFTMPTSVYIDRNDRIYISDGLNRRITIWQILTPDYLAAHPLDRDALRKIEDKVLQLKK